MQPQNVKLVGHLNCSNLYHSLSCVEKIEDDKTWSLFLKTNAINVEASPKIDFTTRKVILVPTNETTKNCYLIYSETLRDHSKKCLEVNFLPFQNDCAAKKILKNARIVLDLPKNEKFDLFIDAHPRTIAEKDQELADHIFKQEKNLIQIKKVECTQTIIKSHFKTDSPELTKALNELQATKKELGWYDKIIEEQVENLRKTLLGPLLNPKTQ